MNPLSLIQLSAYQERSYVELETNEGHIAYGEDNLFPQYLVDLYHSSSTHNALCTTIAQMIYGEGFHPTDLDAGLLTEQWGLQEELRKACLDLKIQGGFALEVQWNLDRSTIAKVNHLPFEMVRAMECDDEGEVNYYQYCLDWTDRQEERHTLCKFSTEEKNDHPNQILYVKPFSPGSIYYPKPDYIGSINYIELDKEISIYHVNNIKNGLAPSFSIHFKNGIPAEEERQRIRMDIERELMGTGNAGKFLLTFSDSPDRAPDFEPFPLSDAHSQYQFLSEESTAKIMIGHRVTNPMMFGVMVGGKLGGGSEVEEATKLFKKQVLDPYRSVVKKAVRELLNACEVNDMLADGQTKLTKQEQASLKLIDYVRARAEKNDWSEWELASEDAVTNPAEEANYIRKEIFSDPRYSNPDEESQMESGLYKIRYAYSTNLSNNSREFCREMVRLSKAGYEFRYEDIQDMSDDGVNGQFAPKGENTYNIFLHKGGAYCHHAWSRRVYFRKRNKKGQFLPDDGLKNDQLVPEASAKRAGVPFDNLDGREWKDASTAPIDTPNRGKIN